MTVALGCSEGSAPGTPPAGPASPSAAAAPERHSGDLVAEGRQAYLGNCVACHNPNPKLEGALGPPVAGASEKLLEARILHAQYPPGYTPKRPTSSMVAMPFLKTRIPALAAFLAQES